MFTNSKLGSEIKILTQTYFDAEVNTNCFLRVDF